MLNINKIINYTILFLILYLPIEGFFLKIISFNNLSFFIFSQFPDIIIFVLFFLNLLIKKKYFDYHKIFTFFILFMIINSMILTLIWGSDLFSSISNLKAFLRYIFLIFLVNSQSLKMYKTYLKAIILSGVIQITIGLIQIIVGQSALTFFSPYELTENNVFQNTFTALRPNNLNIFGTANHNINYSLFLLIVFLVNLNFQKLFNTYIFYILNILIPICIFFSGSRTVFFALMICYLFHIYLNNTLNKKLLFIIPFMFFIAAIFYLFELNISSSSSYSDFSFIFSGNLLSVLQVQRFGILQLFYENFLNINIFGYSPDKEFIATYMTRNFQIPLQIKLSTLILIEDIYFLAFFLYFGIISLFFLFFILHYVYNKVNSFENSNSYVGLLPSLVKNILFISLILNLFNQAFEVRLFSFYFWLLISLILYTLKSENESSFSSQ